MVAKNRQDSAPDLPVGNARELPYRRSLLLTQGIDFPGVASP